MTFAYLYNSYLDFLDQINYCKVITRNHRHVFLLPNSVLLQSKFYEMNRFPNTQAARSRPSASLPGGVHHKSSDNYYLERDARRSVQPPKCIYSTDSHGPVFKSLDGEVIR